MNRPKKPTPIPIDAETLGLVIKSAVEEVLKGVQGNQQASPANFSDEEKDERKRRRIETPRGSIGWRDMAELHEMLEVYEPKPYFMTLREDCPFSSISVCGETFEKKTAVWDDDLRQFETRRGRLAWVADEYVEEIKLYAEKIHYKAHCLYDAPGPGDNIPRKLLGYDRFDRFDAHYDGQAAKIKHGMKRWESGYDKGADGLHQYEWFCLNDFLVVKKRSGDNLETIPAHGFNQEHDLLVDEVKKLRASVLEKDQLLDALNSTHA